MKVLLTNHAMTEMGGTQTWTKTVAGELVNRGIDVDVFTLLKGGFAKEMPCDVFTEIPNKDYDVALVNHNTCLGMLASRQRDYPIIFTSHGPDHVLERPARGADRYVSVSEEVRAVQLALGFTDGVIIRNPIDRETFYRHETEQDVDVLVMCKNIEASDMAESACNRAGLSNTVVHYQRNPVGYDQIPKLMSRHKIVITSGRGVYEAIACGCAPFLFDVRSQRLCGDGWVSDENIAEVAQYNCSGRGSNNYWTESGLMVALQAYDERKTLPAQWVNEYHSVGAVVDKYLSLAVQKGQVAA